LQTLLWAGELDNQDSNSRQDAEIFDGAVAPGMCLLRAYGLCFRGKEGGVVTVSSHFHVPSTGGSQKAEAVLRRKVKVRGGFW
jgi:hypothetical protein